MYRQGLKHLILYSKWGFDGCSGQSEYNQVGTSSKITEYLKLICSLLFCTHQTNWRNDIVAKSCPFYKAVLPTNICGIF